MSAVETVADEAAPDQAESDRVESDRVESDRVESDHPAAEELSVGSEVVVDVGAVAHGGSCVARHGGRVLFVRHTLPGERVTARVTGVGGGGRHLFADAVEVHTAAPGRREPPCPFSGPGRCGGCDWQHVDPAVQRALKADVLAEQLSRLAHIDRRVPVEAVSGDTGGLGWRTRSRFVTDRTGALGLRAHASHDVVPIEACPIAAPAMAVAELAAREWRPRTELDVVVDGDGSRLVLGGSAGRRHRSQHAGGDNARGGNGRGDNGHSDTRPAGGQQPLRVPHLVHHAAGRGWRVTGAGFWQVHPGAPDTLAAAVLDALEPRPGESALDLYAGVGLFAGVLAGALGPTGRVTAVESDPAAAGDARMNLRGLPGTRVVRDVVDADVGRHATGGHADLVVLDPPRTGARREVVTAVVGLRPRAVAYVACDPAALARDVATFAGLGYRLGTLLAYDLFPTTHHLEAVAQLLPDQQVS